MKRAAAKAFQESIDAKRLFLRESLDPLVLVIGLIAEAFRRGNKVLLFGNGGSAADAQHLAAEFVNRFSRNRPPLPAIALTTDTSAITSIANDHNYADVFARQLRALGQRGDVAVGISTSGNAPSVLRALDVARRRGLHTIGLTGGKGGRMPGKVDHLLRVGATTKTARIQEVHILIGHVICEQVERTLFGGRR